MDAWAKKIPHEGESYHPDAYSVYEWSESTAPHARIPHPAEEQRARDLAAQRAAEETQPGEGR
jgi:hypothetical protein